MEEKEVIMDIKGSDLIQFFLDTETTGVDQKNDSIVQLSCIVRVDNRETERHNWYLRPYKKNPMSPESSSVNGYSQEMVDGFPDNSEALGEFREMMDRYHLGQRDPSTGLAIKGYIVGYNVNFDLQMIKEWFEHNGYFDLWFKVYSPVMDVMEFAALPFILKKVRPYMRNFKLATLYETLCGEPMDNAHDSMSDVEATIRIYDSIVSRYFPETL